MIYSKNMIKELFQINKVGIQLHLNKLANIFHKKLKVLKLYLILFEDEEET